MKSKPKMPIINVLDVGARGGIGTILPNWVSRRLIRCYSQHFRFFGIEPDSLAFEASEHLAAEYERLFPIAVSNIVGKQTLYLTNSSDKSSILEPDLKVIGNWAPKDINTYRVKKTIEIETTTVDRLCSDMGIVYDWFKIDTQGSEFEVLLGAKETLNLATVVFAELSTVPQYYNQKTTVEFISAMNEQGFDILLANYKPQMTCENDIVFVRKLSSLSSVKEIFSLALCFSLLYLDEQTNYLLNKIAPLIISESEIIEIREKISLSENQNKVMNRQNRFMNNQNRFMNNQNRFMNIFKTIINRRNHIVCR